MANSRPPYPIDVGRVLSPPLNLYPPNSNDERYHGSLAHFRSVPWCAALLADKITYVPQCFNPANTYSDQYIGATLATDRGLRHVLSFFEPEDAAHVRDPARPIAKVSTFWAVGQGLCGYDNIIHGGMIMSMVDESMGTVLEINTALGKKGLVYEQESVTGELNIKFLRPVPLPAIVCVTAWMESWDGKKSRIRCEVKGENDKVLAACSSTWVVILSKI